MPTDGVLEDRDAKADRNENAPSRVETPLVWRGELIGARRAMGEKCERDAVRSATEELKVRFEFIGKFVGKSDE